MAKSTISTPTLHGSPYRLDVEAELKSIETTYKRVTKSKKTAIAFLKRAGILDTEGKLAKPYR
ncbi:hypothetical protein FEM03_07175 [Phragmitibacter flavus]|uniref:Uncharacterized protein n=1 Tax=Phragmitibacter flavus TaxID=2576071 RepID=A0A5R8KH50_9BACT|nr:hypothetical protein [Phragmitibacter flavus]TLD71305.1 hypothetical protein FEM03_07175 [Phragmitibacter flavus]